MKGIEGPHAGVKPTARHADVLFRHREFQARFHPPTVAVGQSAICGKEMPCQKGLIYHAAVFSIVLFKVEDLVPWGGLR